MEKKIVHVDFLKKVCQCEEKILFTSESHGLPFSSAGKETTCNAEDLGLIPGLERSFREGKGYPLKYSGLENSLDSTVHGVAKSQTQLSDFYFREVSECWKSRNFWIYIGNLNIFSYSW